MAIKETVTLAHLSITCILILKKENQAKTRRTMCSLLKITILLFCVQAGEGHWLRTLLGKPGGHGLWGEGN